MTVMVALKITSTCSSIDGRLFIIAMISAWAFFVLAFSFFVGGAVIALSFRLAVGGA